MKNTKRIVSLLVSLLLIVSSLSVGFVFTASAEEAAFTMKTENTEPVALVKGEAQVGTANYYKYTGATSYMAKEKAFLQSLVAEGSSLLNFGKPTATQSRLKADGSYKVTSVPGSATDVYKNNYANNSIANGEVLNADIAKMQDVNSDGTPKVDASGNPVYLNNGVVKQYGWDGAYYYYDTYMGEKKRDESVTKPVWWEDYTYRMGEGNKVTDIIIASGTTVDLRTSYYEIYINTGNVADLYNPENLYATYNGHQLATNAIAQHFRFDSGVAASNVGIRVIDCATGPQVNKAKHYMGTRIGMLEIYGTNPRGAISVVTVDNENQLKSIKQTTEDETDNYSIPKALNAKNPNYGPGHRYYRNNVPLYAGATVSSSDGIHLNRMWDGYTNADIQQDGRETYKDSNGNLCYFDDTHTETYYDLGDVYQINEIRLGNHNTIALRFSQAGVYASNDFVTLFNEENKITYFEDAFGSATIATQGIEARYIGVYVEDTCYDNTQYPANDYLRMTEFDILGKYVKAGQKATVKNYASANSFSDVRTDMVGKVSLIKKTPEIAIYNKGNVTADVNANNYNQVVDGSIGTEAAQSGLAHKDANGNYACGEDVYTSFFYDLKEIENITEILVAHSYNEYSKAAFYKVYVSEDEEITAADEVAAVLNAGAHTYFKNCANMVVLPEGTKGRFVEIRMYAPAYSASSPANNTTPVNPDSIFYRVQEINIYGDEGYTYVGGGNANKQKYFNDMGDKVINSLIADTPIYNVENVNYLNYGSGKDDVYTGQCFFGRENWNELSKGFTASEYHGGDGDWGGYTFTETIYPCSGGTNHIEGCPQGDSCKGVAKIKENAYQTIIYKLPAKATITEVDLYTASAGVRAPSRYQISFANTAEALFTEEAKNFDVQKIAFNTYDIITLNEPVTAKFFAVRVLCGVHPSIEGTTNTDSNFARMGHLAIQGTSLACGDDAHAFEDVIVTKADCLNAGSKYSVCTVCGFETAAVEIPALGHTEETVEGYPATCTTKGLTDGVKCSVCGEILTAQEEIKELGHTPETVDGKDPTCTEDGLTEGSECAVCGKELTAQDVIDALGHTEVAIGEAKAPTCTEEGITAGVKCSVCEEIIEAQEVIPAKAHRWSDLKVNTFCDKEGYIEITCGDCGKYCVSGKDAEADQYIKDYPFFNLSAKGHEWVIEDGKKICKNGCGEEIALYTVTFVGKDDALLHKVVVEEGGVLTAEDIAAAEAAVPYIKGYKNNGWNVDFSADMVVEANMTIKALYERETETYETKVEDSNGNVLDTEAIQFDQRFTIKDAGATAFLVNDQVVGGAGAVSLYGCGALTIVASTDANIDTSKVSVAILKTETDVVNGANVLRVYTNIYNPANAVVEKTGVIITAGSIYDEKGKFEIDTLADNEKILVEAEVNANQMLATLGGISTTVSNLRRVSRAYAVIGGEYYYSSFIADNEFNK